jgi:hypothetical protein
MDKWTAADSLANALIHDSLSPYYRSSFKWDRTSNENINIFKKIAQDNSLAAIRDLKKDLENLKQQSEEEVIDYCNRWNSVLCGKMLYHNGHYMGLASFNEYMN